jgi:hypothetical protein
MMALLFDKDDCMVAGGRVMPPQGWSMDRSIAEGLGEIFFKKIPLNPLYALRVLLQRGRTFSFNPLFQRGKKFPRSSFFIGKLFVGIYLATIDSRHLPVLTKERSSRRGQRIRNEKAKKAGQ